MYVNCGHVDLEVVRASQMSATGIILSPCILLAVWTEGGVGFNSQATTLPSV